MIKSRRMSWAVHVARMGDLRVAYRFSVGRPGGNKLFGRSKLRWEENIKMNLREVGRCGMNRVDLTRYKDRLRGIVNVVMNSGSMIFGEFLDQVRNC
jgi:hypothetical protein